MSNEDDLFLKEMAGVRPLKKEVREPEKIRDESLRPGLNYRRELSLIHI